MRKDQNKNEPDCNSPEFYGANAKEVEHNELEI